MTPPPRPVPMMAESEVSRLAPPKRVKCPHRAPALPSLRYVTGLPRRFSRLRRDIVARPIGMHEVGGTFGAEHAGGAGGAGSVQADGHDVGNRHACLGGRNL